MTATGDYTKQVHINRPRGRFTTLTAAAEFGAWWAPAPGSADGSVERCGRWLRRRGGAYRQVAGHAT